MKGALTLLVVLMLTPLAARFVAQERIRSSTAILSPEGIDAVQQIELGGIDQSVLLRGRSRKNPVLLWLHGGPGRPFFPLARVHPRAITDRFVVAYWAQRGTPGSNGEGFLYSSLSVDQMVSDSCELIDALRHMFGRQRILLLGDSWGSALGALTAARCPEGLHAYVGVANAVCRCESDAYNLRYAIDHATQDENRMALEELKPIAERASHIGAESLATAEFITIAQWIRHYGGYSRSEAYDHSSRWERLVPHGLGNLLWDPGYSLADLTRFLRSPFRSFRKVFDDFARFDLRRDAATIRVPVLLMHGRHDGSTPFDAAAEYFEGLQAPRGKRMVIFENSGHELLRDEPGKFLATLGAFAAGVGVLDE